MGHVTSLDSGRLVTTCGCRWFSRRQLVHVHDAAQHSTATIEALSFFLRRQVTSCQCSRCAFVCEEHRLLEALGGRPSSSKQMSLHEQHGRFRSSLFARRTRALAMSPGPPGDTVSGLGSSTRLFERRSAWGQTPCWINATTPWLVSTGCMTLTCGERLAVAWKETRVG